MNFVLDPAGHRCVGIALATIGFALGGPSFATAQEASTADLAKANNPLADMKAFNVQNYYIPKLYGVPNEVANNFFIRAAAPTGPVLWRATLPFRTRPSPTGGDAQSTSLVSPVFNSGVFESTGRQWTFRLQ